MKLLIIDPNVSLSSPSMKGVVRSLPALRRAGFEIELWCWHCDDDITAERVVRLPRLGAVRVLCTHAFGFWARLKSWWTFSVRKEPRPDVIYSIAWYLPDCDVCHLQFSPWDWERRQRELGTRSLRDWIERMSNRLGLWTADRFLRRTAARRILCASDAVAADVREAFPGLAPRLGVLPNSFDPLRFNPEARSRWRTTFRHSLAFVDSDRVFIFVSTGHYRRKGFFLAAGAVAQLRRTQPRARLLVVGGSESRLHALRDELDSLHPGWPDFITFTGNVPDVEGYFAAADALLFPSYSEALALVEVEADACGLPLFLTRHHGSEMILQDGVNGRHVDFDAGRIAAVLAEFVSGSWKPSAAERMRMPDTETYALRLADEMLAASRGKSASTLAAAPRSLVTRA
jgi:glycosyltransferase involved in cell wall biosynthesis